MFTFLFYAAIAALVVWIYVDINSARATSRWVLSGAKGVASDVNGLKAQAKQKQVENPDRQNEIVKMLNDDVVDLGGYEVAARARSIASHTELNALIAKHTTE